MTTPENQNIAFQSLGQSSTTMRDQDVRRQAESMALQAIDSLRQVAPEVAPVFEQGGARELIVQQYTRILEEGDVRWEI